MTVSLLSAASAVGRILVPERQRQAPAAAAQPDAAAVAVEPVWACRLGSGRTVVPRVHQLRVHRRSDSHSRLGQARGRAMPRRRWRLADSPLAWSRAPAAVCAVSCAPRPRSLMPGNGFFPYGSGCDNLDGRRVDLLMGLAPIDVVYTWVNGSDPALQRGPRGLQRPLKVRQLVSARRARPSLNVPCCLMPCLRRRSIGVRSRRSGRL